MPQMRPRTALLALAAVPAVAASGGGLRGGAREDAGTLFGYRHYASTTVYGDTPYSSCGSMDTRKLVEGTEYYAVASAQAMQEEFPEYLHGGGCGWECQTANGTSIDRCEYEHDNNTLSEARPLDGCSCHQTGSCMCGSAGNRTAEDEAAAQMGCFTCGRGRFLRRTPYDLNAPDGHTLEEDDEIKVVVADVCPYGPNNMWCPARPGEFNAVGAQNHLDFATRPAIRHYNNNFFVFTPEPCSEKIIKRMRKATSCPDETWPDA